MFGTSIVLLRKPLYDYAVLFLIAAAVLVFAFRLRNFLAEALQRWWFYLASMLLVATGFILMSIPLRDSWRNPITPAAHALMMQESCLNG